MASKVSVPRGTRDVLPAEWRLRDRVLDAARRHLDAAGYGRIQTPTFEHTELFARGVGEGTDIVGKEMYTFRDRGDRSLTLRPEGTAGVVRAYIDHGMHRDPQPVKLWYAMPMFRYEKPQSGRLREHTQVGCEVLGSSSPVVDAELITILHRLYLDLGVPDVVLHLNSIGSPEARSAHRRALVEFLEPLRHELDADSLARVDVNPLRIFDSKVERTRELMQAAPVIAEFLTDEDRAHHEQVQALLASADVPYQLDDRLVRGLDYYTRTVFEFRCSALGAQDTIGAGGRYDGLVETLGGPATPGVGFGCGIERVLLAMEAGGVHSDHAAVDVYVGMVRDEVSAGTRNDAFRVAAELRAAGLRVELDPEERGAGALGKRAGRTGAWGRIMAGATLSFEARDDAPRESLTTFIDIQQQGARS